MKQQNVACSKSGYQSHGVNVWSTKGTLMFQPPDGVNNLLHYQPHLLKVITK